MISAGHTVRMFEQIGGLPLHPLVVHAVVVLVPLATVGALVVAARPAWARPLGPVVAAVALAAAGSAFVAHQAGEALYAALDYGAVPTKAEPLVAHARWGLGTVISAVVLAVLAVAAVALTRREPSVPAARVTAVAAAVAGAVATGFTVLAGESGASSVWGYVFAT